MNFQTILKLTSDLDLQIYNNDNSIVAKGSGENVQAILPLLRLYKDLLIEHFASELEYYSHLYHERAAIYEFDSGLDKEKAEWQALNDTIKLYSDHHDLDIGSDELKQFTNQLIKEVKYA